MSTIANATKRELTNYITKSNINKFFNLESLLTPDITNEVAEVLYNYTIPEIEKLMDSVTSKKILPDFEVNRDKIITTLDKLNFIVEHGYDVKIDRGNSIKAELTTITGNTSSFYGEYENCITYIEDNVNKFYEGIDTTSVDFVTLQFTDDVVKSIISQIFSDKKSLLVGRIKFEVEDLMGKKITDPMMNMIDEKLTSLFKSPKSLKFKFKKSPTRKNNANVSYNIVQSSTDTTEQIKNIFKTKYKVSKLNEKLNYYKK